MFRWMLGFSPILLRRNSSWEEPPPGGVGWGVWVLCRLIVPLSMWFLDHLVRYLLFLVNVAWKQSSPIYFCVLYNVWWVRCFIKQTQSMPRSCLFYTHCFLFSFIMYLLALRHGRENMRTAWWYLLSACWEPKILPLMSVYSYIPCQEKTTIRSNTIRQMWRQISK